MEGCQAGCKVFTCGSYRHHKDCMHYPESLTQYIDELELEIIKMVEEFSINQKSLDPKMAQILDGVRGASKPTKKRF